MKGVAPWLVAGALGFVALQQGCENRALRAESERVAVLQSEVLEERARADGWETRLVRETTNLEAALQEERDENAMHVEEKAALAREVETLGGRLELVTDLYVEARGQIIAHADVHADSSADSWTPESVPDSITANVDDGLLSGRIAYRPEPRAFELTYTAHVSGSLVTAETADGRTLVAARATDPRVALGFGEIYVAAPRVVEACTIGQRAKTVGWALGAWELAKIAWGAR